MLKVCKELVPVSSEIICLEPLSLPYCKSLGLRYLSDSLGPDEFLLYRGCNKNCPDLFFYIFFRTPKGIPTFFYSKLHKGHKLTFTPYSTNCKDYILQTKIIVINSCAQKNVLTNAVQLHLLEQNLGHVDADVEVVFCVTEFVQPSLFMSLCF